MMKIKEDNNGILKIDLTLSLIKYIFALMSFLFGLLPIINSLHENGLWVIPGIIFIILSIMIVTSTNTLIIDSTTKQITHKVWSFFGLVNKNLVVNFEDVGKRGFYLQLSEIRRRGKNLIVCHLLLHTPKNIYDLFSCPEMFKEKLKIIIQKANQCLIGSGIYVEVPENYYKSPIS